MVKFSLSPIALNGSKGLYSARIRTIGTINIDQLADTIVRQGCTIGKDDVIAVLKQVNAAIGMYLQMGYIVHTPFALFRPGIRGRFEGIQDGFDRSRHELKVNVMASATLADSLLDVPVEKIESSDKEPNILSFTNHNSSKELEISPGGVGSLKGYRLDFDPSDTEQGIYLVNGSSTAKVDVVVKNSPKELIFAIPATLNKGGYTIEVRKKFYTSKVLKTDRIADLKVA